MSEKENFFTENNLYFTQGNLNSGNLKESISSNEEEAPKSSINGENEKKKKNIVDQNSFEQKNIITKITTIITCDASTQTEKYFTLDDESEEEGELPQQAKKIDLIDGESEETPDQGKSQLLSNKRKRK